MWSHARQPTIRRENASNTNATYAIPFHVGTYVRSATQSTFGPATENVRSTRSLGTARDSSATVVGL